MGVQAAVIAVTLLNRLEGDQVNSTAQQLAEFEERPIKAVVKYVLTDYKQYVEEKKDKYKGKTDILERSDEDS